MAMKFSMFNFDSQTNKMSRVVYKKTCWIASQTPSDFPKQKKETHARFRDDDFAKNDQQAWRHKSVKSREKDSYKYRDRRHVIRRENFILPYKESQKVNTGSSSRKMLIKFFVDLM